MKSENSAKMAFNFSLFSTKISNNKYDYVSKCCPYLQNIISTNPFEKYDTTICASQKEVIENHITEKEVAQQCKNIETSNGRCSLLSPCSIIELK